MLHVSVPVTPDVAVLIQLVIALHIGRRGRPPLGLTSLSSSGSSDCHWDPPKAPDRHSNSSTCTGSFSVSTSNPWVLKLGRRCSSSDGLLVRSLAPSRGSA